MITIVTDSCACIKRSDAEVLGVKVVPMSYTVNGHVHMESFCDANGDYEARLKGCVHYTTSQPNPSAFLSCFEEELARGQDVLCITISSRLSGTYSVAHIAAKQSDSDRVAVFDSQLTGGGQFLLIKKAAELIQEGLTLPDIMEGLQRFRKLITIVFTVDDMNPLRRSGRIGFVRMSVEAILNKKPLLTLSDGVVMAGGIARGSADAIKKLSRMVTGDVKEIIINYSGGGRMAAALYNVLESAFPDVPIGLNKLGPVLGMHLGTNVTAVSFINGAKEQLEVGVI